MGKLREMARVLAAALLLGFSAGARAHYCGPGDMTIRVGQTALYSILAESGEPFHIDASVLFPPDTNVAVVDVSSVTDVLNAHFGIIGVRPGTTSVGFQWNNPLNGASGYCVVAVTVVAVAPGKSTANTPYAPTTDEPVNAATGELFFEKPPDLYLAGPMPLLFQRYYASRLLEDGLSTVAMGNNWRHNFDFHLETSPGGSSILIDDAHGRTISFQATNGGWNLVAPVSVPFQLAASGTNFVLGDPIAGRLYTFNSGGLLLTIADRRGNVQYLSYAGAALAGVTDNLGRSLRFSYDTNGYLAGVTDGTRAVAFTYDTFALSSVTDARGNTSRYLYDTNNSVPGLLVSETLPLGNVRLTQTYDSSGRVTAQADPFGHVWSFVYSNLLTFITNPAGQTVEYAWDDSGNMTAYTDENGRTMSTGYDAAGRRSTSTDRRGKTTSASFDPASGRLASFTEADGAVTTLEYTNSTTQGILFRDLTAVAYPDAHAQTFTNDANGSLTGLADRAGNTQAYSLNPRGQVVAAVNTAGGLTTYSYNADGTLAGLTTPSGDTTRFAYDPLKRVVGVTNADGTIRRYAYDPSDALTSVTDERGKTSAASFDANGNLISMTDPLGNITRLSYDAMDRLTAVTDPAGHACRRTYDALGRVNSFSDRNGNGGTLAYDGPGRLLTVTDGTGGVWRRGYDPEGNVTSETDPLGNLRAYARDAVGRLLAATNPSSSTIVLAYDSMGRQQSLQDPLGQTTRLAYDPRALLSGVALPGGIAAGFLRDHYGLVGQVTDPNGQAWTLLHDSQGRLTSFSDPLARATSFLYDPRGRAAQATYPAGLGVCAFSYDPAGNLTLEHYSDGSNISYSYDDANRLVSAAGVSLAYDAAGNITQNNGLTLGRDAGGRVSSLTVAPGKVVNYTWDSRNLVTAVDDWAGGHTALAYDAAQRLVSISRPNGIATTFAYNPDGFLISVQEAKGGAILAGASVTRDAKGQITASARNYPADQPPPAISVRLKYDAASQAAGFGYDALGRLLADGKRSYSWNLASKLTGYMETGAPVALTYDAFGLLQTRTAAGVTRQYVWNHADGLPSLDVVRQAGADLRYYVRTPSGALLYSIESASNQRRFYHFDELGNTAFLTDDGANVTDTYSFTPYGLPVASSGSTDNPFTFGGAYGMMREGATGLYYARTRYYDAATARFLSRDRLLRSFSPNETDPYAFNRQNPAAFSDPWGRDARINKDGPDAVHTDISVDIWAGDRIIGVLTVSFARQGWGGKSGFTKAVELIPLITTGLQGEFTASFALGKSIADSQVYPGSVVVHGTREQDERLAAEMLKATALYNPHVNDPNPTGLFFQNLIRNNRTEDGGKRSSFNLKPPLATGDWDTYRLENRTCNTFTSAMLNVYFGRDVGTVVTAGGVMENLEALQHPSPADDSQEPDPYQYFYGPY